MAQFIVIRQVDAGSQVSGLLLGQRAIDDPQPAQKIFIDPAVGQHYKQGKCQSDLQEREDQVAIVRLNVFPVRDIEDHPHVAAGGVD